jgi:flagellar L-ring protein precursor FlgH
MGTERWVKRIVWTGCAGFLLFGCIGNLPRVPTSDFEKDRISKASPPPSPPEEGSLWSSRGSACLYADVKARQVGDVVTISIVESARASKNATTKTGRDSGLQASWSGLFDSIAGNWSINGQKIGTSHQIDLANNFDGQGETTRSSMMTAYITARVVRVFPNGTMVIQGTRQVQVNSETQYIFIQGLIRPEDISSSNIILSTFVAEAIIEMNGHGPVSDKQSPGWLMRIVDWAWPF